MKNNKRMKLKDKVIEELAKVGYEKFYDDKWIYEPKNTIEKKMWKDIAEAMLDKLEEMWKSED